MDPVRVKVMTTPRLLADLITVALDSPALSVWTLGDSPALVTIINSETGEATDSRLTIVLGDRLEDPVLVITDGQRSDGPPTRPHELHRLVLELARSLPYSHEPVPDEACG